jgi:hypothetical protein
MVKNAGEISQFLCSGTIALSRKNGPVKIIMKKGGYALFPDSRTAPQIPIAEMTITMLTGDLVGWGIGVVGTGIG